MQQGYKSSRPNPSGLLSPARFYLLRVLKTFPVTVPVRVGTHDPGGAPSTLGEPYESCVERPGIHPLGTFLQARG